MADTHIPKEDLVALNFQAAAKDEPRTAEERPSLTVLDNYGYPLKFEIDSDGDMDILDEDCSLLYVAKGELPKLRDWLIKVLSP
jgi:hypothetical protein